MMWLYLVRSTKKNLVDKKNQSGMTPRFLGSKSWCRNVPGLLITCADPSNATPPLGKITPFTKIAVTFEQMKEFRCPSEFRISKKLKHFYFMTESTILNN